LLLASSALLLVLLVLVFGVIVLPPLPGAVDLFVPSHSVLVLVQPPGPVHVHVAWAFVIFEQVSPVRLPCFFYEHTLYVTRSDFAVCNVVTFGAKRALLPGAILCSLWKLARLAARMQPPIVAEAATGRIGGIQRLEEVYFQSKVSHILARVPVRAPTSEAKLPFVAHLEFLCCHALEVNSKQNTILSLRPAEFWRRGPAVVTLVLQRGYLASHANNTAAFRGAARQVADLVVPGTTERAWDACCKQTNQHSASRLHGPI